MAEIGKRGVMAKRVAIEESRKMYQEGVKMTAVIKETARKMDAAVKAIEVRISEIQSAIQIQVKENEEAVANIGKGVQQVLSGVKKLGDEFKRYIRDFWYG